MRLRPFFILLAAAAAANASSVREGAAVNPIQPPGANLRACSFTDSLNGAIDLSSEWTLTLGGSLTLQGRTPASQRGQFPESGSVVTLFPAGADWNLTENLTLGTEAKVSPRSTQFAGTTATVRQADGTETAADALVRSQTSQAGGAFNVSWETTGNSALEWSYGAGVGYSHYDVDQNVSRVRPADGTAVTSATLRRDPAAD